MPHNIAVYIHVPFCRRKCNYCSFVSYEDREAEIPAYVSVLKKELARRGHGEGVCSVYFGGGTPSLLSAEQIGDILALVSSAFVVGEKVEVTMEANPGTVDMTYLADVRSRGINRLSLGVQSMNDDELLLMGRIHTRAEAADAVRFARDAGFDNLSLDLIYGLPGQTLPDWQNTLDEVLEMGPEHLSLYCLHLEAGTPMWAAIESKQIPDIDTDLSADQYELAEDMLSGHGYRHYEISNWAKPGKECRHNMIYWKCLPYLGAGVAAHSFINGRRLANPESLAEYLAANGLELEVDPDKESSPELQLAEKIFLGLRLCDGISVDDINSHFGIDLMEYYSHQVEEIVEAGLLEFAGRQLRLTRRGRLLSNEVFWRFLPGDNTCKLKSGLTSGSGDLSRES